MFKFLTIFVFVSLVLIAPWPAFAKYMIRWETSLGPDSPSGLGMLHFAKVVSQKTNGDIMVELGFNGRMGKKKYNQISAIQAAANGELEMTSQAADILANLDPKIGVLGMPYLFHDYAHADKVLDSPLMDKISEGLLSYRLLPLAYSYSGFRIIPTKTLEIHKPEDLKNVRLRTMEAPVSIALYKQWGAETVPGTNREIVNMAKKGFIEGADRSYSTFWDLHQYEVFKVINATNHALVITPTLVNQPFFQSLPKAYQNIIRTAAQEAAIMTRKKAQEGDIQVQKNCEKMGIKIVNLTPEEKQEFETSVKPVYQEFENRFGKELIQSIRNM